MSGDWRKQTFHLSERNNWHARPGNAICVLDRGAIRFDYPGIWKVTPESDAICVRDQAPPDDNAVLKVSRLPFPPEMADGVPLSHLVEATQQDDDREILERRPVLEVAREDGIELVLTECLHRDPGTQREAIARLAIARGSGVYCLITFDFWADDLATCDPVWQEALRSLTLGMYLDDPTHGPVVH